MKNFIAYLCIFIFSFQVLPVKEIGKILFKQQLTEEVKDCDCSQDEGEDCFKVKKEGDPIDYNASYQSFARVQHLSHELHTAIHESESLPIHHVADVFTPPPNC